MLGLVAVVIPFFGLAGLIGLDHFHSVADEGICCRPASPRWASALEADVAVGIAIGLWSLTRALAAATGRRAGWGYLAPVALTVALAGSVMLVFGVVFGPENAGFSRIL